MSAARLAPAVAVSLLFILWAPFIGQIRNWLKATFPGAFVGLVAGLVAAAVVAGLAVALWRIRERRGLRYGLLAAAVGLFVWYAWYFRTGNAEVDAVERFHFVEYGIVASLFYRAFLPRGDRSVAALALLAGFLAGTLEEWVQWLVPTRVGVAADVFLNLYALGCGLLFAAGLISPAPLARPARAGSARLIFRIAAVVVLVFAAFFDCAHLGYEIRDDAAGTFRSYSTAPDLGRLAIERREAWRRSPPTELRALAVEDYYMTEGGWHARERNDAYARGDFAAAWHENLILETYFDPFLDVISFVGRERHRWHPDQRREVESKRGGPIEYVSPALASRIVVYPTRTTFWIVALLVVGLLWAAPRAARFAP